AAGPGRGRADGAVGARVGRRRVRAAARARRGGGGLPRAQARRGRTRRAAGGRRARRPARPARCRGPGAPAVTAARVARPLAVAVLVGALVWWSGPPALLGAVSALQAGPVLAALALGVVTTVANAWRWCLVARGLGLRLSLPTAVADCYQALFLNAVLPAGMLGDVHRAIGHGRRNGDVGRGVRAVVLERLVGLVVLVAVAAVVLALQPTLLGVLADLVPGAGWLGIGLLAALPVLGWCLRGRLRPVAAEVRAVLGSGAAPAIV